MRTLHFDEHQAAVIPSIAVIIVLRTAWMTMESVTALQDNPFVLQEILFNRAGVALVFIALVVSDSAGYACFYIVSRSYQITIQARSAGVCLLCSSSCFCFSVCNEAAFFLPVAPWSLLPG